MKVNKVDIAWYFEEFHDIVLPPGNQGKIRCPFHGERVPSMAVYKDSGRACCFAGCFGSRAVDVLDILQETENLSFLEAVELTKSWPGTLVDMADSSGPSKSQRNKRAAKKKFAFKILGE